MLKKYSLMVLVSAATCVACNPIEMTEPLPAGNKAIYADYKVWGEEGKEMVTVLIQYRDGGPDGAAIVLEKPAGVAVDSMPLRADSAGISGAYYEVAFPSAGFAGDHVIEYTGTEGKKHRQPFTFSPFTFRDEPPATLPMKPVTFHLRGLPPEITLLELIMTDTAFATNDIHAKMKVQNGALKITGEMWKALKPGPIVLEIYKEEERQLSSFSKAGGVIKISYGLKRAFIALPLSNDTAGRHDAALNKKL